jgi:hypothetical protein
MIFGYGVVSGAIIIGAMILTLGLVDKQGSLPILQIVGYLIMFAALMVIFVGIKRYRDRELGGVIRFGTAMLLGLGISAVAGVIYVAVWEVNLAATDFAFIDEYTEAAIEGQVAAGVTGTELEAYRAEMETFKEEYRIPVRRLPMTFLEIFPVGLLITLVSAALLRNSDFLPKAG